MRPDDPLVQLSYLAEKLGARKGTPGAATTFCESVLKHPASSAIMAFCYLLEKSKMSMQDSPTNYGAVSRVNHWVGALIVLTLLGIGLYFSDMPRGPEKSFWRNLHIAIGTIASLFLLFRVFWRLRSTSPLALPQKPALQMFSKIVHWLLLAGIVVLAITGPLSIWSTGRPIKIFDLAAIPSPFPAFRSLHGPLEDIHSFVADAMMYLIGLHLLGVIKHQFIDHDGILKRMTGRA
jgi:cytochrome b561